MRNSQRDNGYGRSGVNKKISTNGWKWSERGKSALCASVWTAGFYGAFSDSPWAASFLHSSWKMELHLSRCRSVNSASAWITTFKYWKKKKSLACPLLQTQPVEVLSRKPAATFNNQTCVTVHFLSWIRSASVDVWAERQRAWAVAQCDNRVAKKQTLPN